MGKLAGTRRSLPVGSEPAAFRHKRSPGAKPRGRDNGALVAELEAFPMARKEPACLCRWSMPGEAVPARPAAEASREEPDMQQTANRKPETLSKSQHPGKSKNAQIAQPALGNNPGSNLRVAADRPRSPDPTPLGSTCNNPYRSSQVSWDWERSA